VTIRLYDPQNPSDTFSAESELAFVEEKLYEILFTVGITDFVLDELTIDDIVLAIRNMVPFTKNESYGDTYIIDPSSTILNSMSIFLIGNARRLWFRRQIAKAEL
jgi:hypothetical protein